MNKRTLTSFLLLAVLQASPAMAASVDFEWRANTESDLSGYRVFRATYSLLSLTTAQAMAAGAVTKLQVPAPSTFTTLTSIPEGATYYFRLTAYDTAGNQSGFNLDDADQPLQISTYVPDATAPGTVSTLAVTGRSTGTVSLAWTAVGDDGSTGVAASYDIRYGTYALTAGNWPAAAQASGEPAPIQAGLGQTFTAGSLNENTVYYFGIRVFDDAGNQSALSNIVSTRTLILDLSAPSVSLSAPSDGSTVAGSVTLSASASDNVGVVGVQFKVDGVNVGAEDTSSPYSVTWNSALVANGAHAVTAVARDAAGNTSTSTAVSVTVNNGSGGGSGDTSKPSVSVTGPTAGATVSGSVTLSANASDNVGVAGVQFVVNSANVGAEDTIAPYAVSWDSSLFSDGLYALSAVARDAAGNVSTATAVSVTVDNTPPVLSNIAHTVYTSSAVITWTSNEPADSRVFYGTSVSLGSSLPRDPTMITSHSMTLTGLAPDTVYYYTVRSADVRGFSATSSARSFKTAVAADASAPEITLIRIEKTGRASAEISWVTNEPAFSRIEYGPTSSYGTASAWSTTPQTQHRIRLDSLQPGTLYHFRAMSRDAAGNTATSSDFSFRTQARRRPLVTFAPDTSVTHLPDRLLVVKATLVPESSDGNGDGALEGFELALLYDDRTSGDMLFQVLMARGQGNEFVGFIRLDDLALAEGRLRFLCELRDAETSTTARTSETVIRVSRTVELPRQHTNYFELPDAHPADGHFSARFSRDERVDTVVLQLMRETDVPPLRLDGQPNATLVRAFDIQADGRTSSVFNRPVTLTFVYPDVDGTDANGDGLPDGDGYVDGTSIHESDLSVAWLDNRRWVLMGGRVDPAANTITIQVSHFSVYALVSASRINEAKAAETFLSPALQDGINDVATFGLEAVEVLVMDSNGRRVFEQKSSDVADSAIAWNCRDEDGKIVPSGAYVARIKKKDGGTVFQSLVVVK